MVDGENETNVENVEGDVNVGEQSGQGVQAGEQGGGGESQPAEQGLGEQGDE